MTDMMQMLYVVYMVVMPIGVSAIIEHMLYKNGYFQFLAKPISVKYFGKNKMYRGMIVLPIINALFLSIIPSNYENPFMFGFMSAFVFNLSELPNSYAKRKCRVPDGSNAWFFVDHLDSVCGTALYCYLVNVFTIKTTLLAILIAPIVHMIHKYIRTKYL